MIAHAHYAMPLGTVTIGYEADAVTGILINCADNQPHTPTPVTDLAAAQLLEYFQGQRRDFDFPFRFRGTAFQNSIWSALCRIPYGETRTYGQIAAAVGKPKAARAVGMACNRNPLWIVVPCHRVVGQNAALTGYAGGIPMKEALLELESRHK